MLRDYLLSAQDVLVAKKEIYDVKNQRLRLAEDEYNMLTKMAASRNSCTYKGIYILSDSCFDVFVSIIFHSIFIELFNKYATRSGIAES